MPLQLEKLKVSELKEELSARGLPVDGIKSVLCARLEGWLLARREPQQVCCGPVAIISRGCRRRHSRRREGGIYIRVLHPGCWLYDAAFVGSNRHRWTGCVYSATSARSPPGRSEPRGRRELTGG